VRAAGRPRRPPAPPPRGGATRRHTPRRRPDGPPTRATPPRRPSPFPPNPQDFIQERSEFLDKVNSKSGLDPNGTYLPPAVNPTVSKDYTIDMKTAMLEAEMVMGGAVADVLEKTGERLFPFAKRGACSACGARVSSCGGGGARRGGPRARVTRGVGAAPGRRGPCRAPRRPQGAGCGVWRYIWRGPGPAGRPAGRGRAPAGAPRARVTPARQRAAPRPPPPARRPHRGPCRAPETH
jgi:hypothetical protein